MGRFVSFVLVLFSSASLCAQSSLVDDLRAQLKTPLSDSAQVMVKTQLARELIYIDNAEAYQLVQEALTHANEKGLELEGAYALRILGAVMREYGFYLKGSEVLLDAKAIFEAYNDSLGVANCYLSLGNFYNYLADHEMAIANERKAVAILEKLKVPDRLGVIYNNISRSFYDVQNYDSAIYYCFKAIAVSTSIKHYSLIQSNYRNLGMVYLAMNLLDSAKEAFGEVLRLHASQGNYSNKWAAAESYLGLAKMYIQTGEMDQVSPNIAMAKELCIEFGYLDILKEVIQTAFEYYKLVEDYEQVDQLWFTYQELTDSLLLIERDNKKYIVDWYEERIQKDSEIAAFTVKLGRQKIQIVVLVLIVLFVLIILVLFVSNIRKVRRINAILQDQKGELESLNQTKNKLFSIVAHDFISPLSNVYSFSRLLVEDRHIEPEDRKLIIKELNQSVENTIGLTKNLLTWARSQMDGETFNPSTVEVGVLLKYVVKSISSQAKSKEIDIDIQLDREASIFGDPAQLEVVFRNLLSNSIKFSQPSQRVLVKVEAKGNLCLISFIDQGIGMDMEVLNSLFKISEYNNVRGTAGEKGTGLGLIISKEFIEKNFGAMSVDSEKNLGTTITLTFPLI